MICGSYYKSKVDKNILVHYHIDIFEHICIDLNSKMFELTLKSKNKSIVFM